MVILVYFHILFMSYWLFLLIYLFSIIKIAGTRGVGSIPFIVAFYGVGLCLAVDFYRILMMIMMMNGVNSAFSKSDIKCLSKYKFGDMGREFLCYKIYISFRKMHSMNT